MKTLLIVDDDAALRDVMRKVLEKAGYSVLTAANGTEGLDLLRSTQVAAVITDIIMPEMEGLETIRTMRVSWPNLPIVAISGGGRPNRADFLRAAQAFGAKRTLHKPFRNDELLEAVRFAIGD